MARLLKTDHSEPVTLTLPTGPQLLPELQRLVGGYIEVLIIATEADGSQRVLVFDEDGKRKQLPVNIPATTIALLNKRLPGDDHIVGDVLDCIIEHPGTDAEHWR